MPVTWVWLPVTAEVAFRMLPCIKQPKEKSVSPWPCPLPKLCDLVLSLDSLSKEILAIQQWYTYSTNLELFGLDFHVGFFSNPVSPSRKWGWVGSTWLSEVLIWYICWFCMWPDGQFTTLDGGGWFFTLASQRCLPVWKLWPFLVRKIRAWWNRGRGLAASTFKFS